MGVLIAHRQRAVPVSDRIIRLAVETTLRLERHEVPVEVSVAIVDDAQIRLLNRRYRGTDRATDVLAFPQAGPSPEPLLGDVVISAERAAAQARRYRHSLGREVALLASHGVLHLLGYDDRTVTGRREMRRRQAAVLRSLEEAGAFRA